MAEQLARAADLVWSYPVVGLCLLSALYYRELDPASGEARGGPMYYIVAGLGPRWRPISLFYALTIAFAGFGFTCMFQSNQAADALRVHFSIPGWATGAVLAGLTAAVIIGGIESIGRWAARIVPLMCLVYVSGAILICVTHVELLPAVAGCWSYPT